MLLHRTKGVYTPLTVLKPYNYIYLDYLFSIIYLEQLASSNPKLWMASNK